MFHVCNLFFTHFVTLWFREGSCRSTGILIAGMRSIVSFIYLSIYIFIMLRFTYYSWKVFIRGHSRRLIPNIKSQIKISPYIFPNLRNIVTLRATTDPQPKSKSYKRGTLHHFGNTTKVTKQQTRTYFHTLSRIPITWHDTPHMIEWS